MIKNVIFTKVIFMNVIRSDTEMLQTAKIGIDFEIEENLILDEAKFWLNSDILCHQILGHVKLYKQDG